MGTDIHGPWIERTFTDWSGKKSAVCIAALPVFDRDYVAFGLMASGVRGQYEQAITEPRGIPSVASWQWQRHMADDIRHGMEWRAREHEASPEVWPAIEPWDWKRNWREEWWRNRDEYRNCYGHSWLTTDEVEEAQRRYIRYHQTWAEEDPTSFAARGIEPYPGFRIALAAMREAEAIYGQPCRLVFCFDC